MWALKFPLGAVAMRNKLRPIAMLVVAFGMLQTSGFAQCVMCGTALASSPEGQAIAGSFRSGILILLVAPYIVAGLFGYGIFRAFRKRSAGKSLS
jgi:hypothetical protein